MPLNKSKMNSTLLLQKEVHGVQVELRGLLNTFP